MALPPGLQCRSQTINVDIVYYVPIIMSSTNILLTNSCTVSLRAEVND